MQLDSAKVLSFFPLGNLEMILEIN